MEQKVWQIALAKPGRIEGEKFWYHPAISIATDDCVEYIKIAKKARIEEDMEDHGRDTGLHVDATKITKGTFTINNSINSSITSLKTFIVTIEVDAHDAAEAVAKVQGFARSVKVEVKPGNVYGTTVNF